MPRPTSLVRVVALVGAVLALATPAHADPLVDDDTGETQTISVCVTDECIGVSSPNEPAIDIDSGTIAVASGALVFSTTVVDLDHPGTGGIWTTPDDQARYAFGFKVSDMHVTVAAGRDFGHTTSAASVQINELGHVQLPTTAAFAFDDAANTVSVTVPIDDLDDVVHQACPTCAAVGTGSVLSEIVVVTQVMKKVPAVDVTIGGTNSDSAQADGNFTI